MIPKNNIKVNNSKVNKKAVQPPLTTNPYNPKPPTSPASGGESKKPLTGSSKLPTVGGNIIGDSIVPKPGTERPPTSPITGGGVVTPNPQLEQLTTQLQTLTNQLNILTQTESSLNQQIGDLNEQLTLLQKQCEEIAAAQLQAEQDFQSTKNDCNSLSVEIEMVQQQLINTPNNSVSGCTSNSEYNSLLAYLETLKQKYKSCIEGAVSTNISTYNTVFITQIYETNEYEGNVTVIGDNEWDDNDQLIVDCV
jgi:predicted RNase H-like nuclease (RuvC/YqgF family)